MLSFFHLNARSLGNKHDDVDMFLNSLHYTFDILVFTETWFTNREDAVVFPGYKCEGVYRSGRKGGGVSLYIHDNLNYEVLYEFSKVTVDYESLVVKYCSLVVVAAYRPPAGSLTKFFRFIENVLEYANSLHLSIVLIGDFNVDLISQTSGSLELFDIVQSYGCDNIIHLPTRITPETETLIDLCITNCHREAAGVLSCDLSDHLPIFAFIVCPTYSKSGYNDTAVIFRNINDSSIQQFYSSAANINWDPVFNETDPNKSYNVFLNLLKNCYELSFPWQELKKHKKSKKPWISCTLY